MFSLLSELLKQLMQLATYRSARKRELFDKLIESNYRKAENATNDLFVFYRELSAYALSINGYGSGEEEFVQSVRAKQPELEASRQRLLSVRMELLIASKSLKSKGIFRDKRLDEYAEEMFENILYILQDPEKDSSSRPQNFLDALYLCLEPTDPSSTWKDSKWFVTTCMGQLRSLIKSTEWSWGQATEYYTKLRSEIYLS